MLAYMEHTIFGYPTNRNPSTDQNEILRNRLRRQGRAMCQKWFESVGWGRPHRWVKYNLKTSLLEWLPVPALPRQY